MEVKKLINHITEILLRLFKLFVVIERVGKNDYKQIKLFLKKNRPHTTEKKLLRLGSDGDGGYLCPDDLEGINYCFSPGVFDNSDFEFDLFKNFNIRSYMCDYSVDQPPINCEGFMFKKKFLGSYSDKNYLSLSDWILSENFDNEMILQMDIEGAEYDVLISTDSSILSKFRILIIEFHNFNMIFSEFGFKMINSVFDKLSKDFLVVHIHPNKCCKTVICGDIEIPPVLEYTFIRKDRVKNKSLNLTFPHKQDHDKDFVLPKSFFDI